MTESNFEKWLNTKEYIAEEKLLDLTEYLCEIDQKQGFKFRILLGIIEWCVHKIIYKRGLKRNMKLEDQFPTKEQCEKLVKIGVVLDTSQFWVCCGGKWQMGIGKSFLEELGPAIISAPSVAELGVLLPDVIVHNETGVWYNLLIWKSTSISWNAGYFDDEYKILVNRWADQSLANVLADRLTWLIENGYLKVEDLKL